MRAAPPGGERRLGRPPGASIFRARCAGFSESYIRNLMFFHEPHGRKGLGSESGGKSCALILPYVAIASGMAKPISSHAAPAPAGRPECLRLHSLFSKKTARPQPFDESAHDMFAENGNRQITRWNRRA